MAKTFLANKPSQVETTKQDVPTRVDTSTGGGRLYNFKDYQVATTAHGSHGIARRNERKLLDLFRELSEKARAEVEAFAECKRGEERQRQLIREAFEMSSRSLARCWDADESSEKDI